MKEVTVFCAQRVPGLEACELERSCKHDPAAAVLKESDEGWQRLNG